MNKNATKRSLLASVMALVLCVVMLVGTTFAWFTDTASTSVNKIVSGKLDVALEMQVGEEWVNAEGQTLQFKKAGDAAEQVLWEPGCRYELPKLRVVNNGNLALKYKVAITGITGDAKLNEVIDWTINGADISLTEQHLAALQAGDGFVIKGVMQTTAGNEYQNLSIDGIGITVYATQDTVERDSFDENYDRNATYYPVIDIKGLTNALSIGGDVIVDADVTVYGTDARMWRTMITKPTTLQLNKKIISPDGMADNQNYNYAALFVGADTTINAGKDGGIDTGTNGAYAINVIDGAKLTINSGSYYGGGTAVQVHKGELVINGGFFAVEPYNDPVYGNKFLLNCVDAYLRDGTAKITVKGGTFVNYDPSDSASENPHGNFVADGYDVVRETKANGDVWYTVVKGTGVLPTTAEEMNTGIKNSATKDVTVVMPADTSFTLDNGVANEGANSRNVTFVGDGSQTVDVIKKSINAENGMLSYQRGSTFTFENLAVQAGEGSFDGIVCDELIYKNCTIKGKLTLYGKATFINCTFENTMADQYSIWTWGGTDVTVEGCTFNTNGKAILLYGRGSTNLVVNNCVFNDRNGGIAKKAAIEVGDDYHATYTLTINNIQVNGFANGKFTDSKLWANKNQMDATHLTVTIDGSKIQ